MIQKIDLFIVFNVKLKSSFTVYFILNRTNNSHRKLVATYLSIVNSFKDVLEQF